MPRLSTETIKEIRDALSRGEKWSEIMKNFGISKKTVSRIAKLTDQEIEELEKKELKSKTEEKIRVSRYPVPSGQVAVRRELEDEIVKRSTSDIVQALDIGYWCLKTRIKDIAETLGMTPKKLITRSVGFYVFRRKEYQKLVEKYEGLKVLVKRLLLLLAPEIQRRLKIRMLLLAMSVYLRHGVKPPEELVNAFKDEVMGNKKKEEVVVNG
ncbi:MAG: hypothetical protein DRP12_00220 [Candidatus Aenigmatarchaeota archaeon]|nr:MAG: hypothetical protein DRP12_00220 [Candidatus Aenigmarchaeota archaeon]